MVRKWFGKRRLDKWEKLGYVAALFNPLPTGLLASYYLSRERRYRRTGRNVLVISILVLLLCLWVIYATYGFLF